MHPPLPALFEVLCLSPHTTVVISLCISHPYRLLLSRSYGGFAKLSGYGDLWNGISSNILEFNVHNFTFLNFRANTGTSSISTSLYGAIIYDAYSYSRTKMYDCTFNRTRATYGGLYYSSSSPGNWELNGCTGSNLRSTSYGGIGYAYYASARFIDTKLSDVFSTYYSIVYGFYMTLYTENTEFVGFVDAASSAAYVVYGGAVIDSSTFRDCDVSNAVIMHYPYTYFTSNGIQIRDSVFTGTAPLSANRSIPI